MSDDFFDGTTLGTVLAEGFGTVADDIREGRWESRPTTFDEMFAFLGPRKLAAIHQRTDWWLRCRSKPLVSRPVKLYPRRSKLRRDVYAREQERRRNEAWWAERAGRRRG